MRRFVSVLLYGLPLGAALSLGCLFFEWRSVGKLPRILLEPRSLDFGELRIGERASADVKIWNMGERELRIDRVHLSCGCTDAEVSHHIVEPGDFSLCRVTIDGRGGRGPKHESITIHSDDPVDRHVSLPVKAFVGLNAVVRPSIVDFGKVSIDSLPKEVSVSISGGAAREAEKAKCEANTPFHRLDLRAVRLGDTLHVSASVLRTDAAVGIIAGEVEVALHAETGVRLIRVPVRGEVVGQCSLNPPSLLLQPSQSHVVSWFVTQGNRMFRVLEMRVKCP